MFSAAESTLTWKEWIAILVRNFDLDVEKLHRREYRRYDVEGGLVNVEFESVPDGSSLPEPTSMTLLDVSPTGFMARSFREYEPGTTVAVELIFADAQSRGRARLVHCTSTLGGYKTGFELQFEDGPPKD